MSWKLLWDKKLKKREINQWVKIQGLNQAHQEEPGVQAWVLVIKAHHLDILNTVDHLQAILTTEDHHQVILITEAHLQVTQTTEAHLQDNKDLQVLLAVHHQAECHLIEAQAGNQVNPDPQDKDHQAALPAIYLEAIKSDDIEIITKISRDELYVYHLK